VAVDRNNVSEPHGNLGEIVSNNFLNFAAELFSFFLIGLHMNLIA